MSELEHRRVDDQMPGGTDHIPAPEPPPPPPDVIDGEPTLSRSEPSAELRPTGERQDAVDGEPSIGPPEPLADQPGHSSALIDGEPPIGPPAGVDALGGLSDGQDTADAAVQEHIDGDTGELTQNPAAGGDSPIHRDQPGASGATDELTDGGHQDDPDGNPDEPGGAVKDIITDPRPDVAEPLDDSEQQDFADYRKDLEDQGKTRQVTQVGPEYDYQREHCGDTEYRISPDANLPKSAWADGLNGELALAQDAKYVKTDTRSWFVPDSMPPAMQGLAEEVMDKRLIKYRDVIQDGTNPIRGLEIIVNSPAAAQAVAARMNALNIPGIVRIRP